MKKNLIIIGAGNVGAFVAYNLDLFDEKFILLGFLDDDIHKKGRIIAGHQVLGNVDDLRSFPAGTAVAVGIADPVSRKRIVNKIQTLPVVFPNFISCRAWLSREVRVGRGAIIYPGVSINYESVLGDFVIINMNCALGHNATVSDFCSLAPGVNFSGFTYLEEGVSMGIGSATRQNARIGRGSTIGGQAFVIGNVPEGSIVMGIPGKPKVRTSPREGK
ncbi:MAG: hypothetical protein SCM96_15840 [Acidobacteriota bacterium]|nr:hypothetical protein [Acidobacteriota bacterium]